MAARSRRKPQRTCVVCRKTGDKRTLVRIVRGADGVVHVDPTGKANGRGAYVCKDRACWEKLLSRQGVLVAALKTQLDDASRAELTAYADALNSQDGHMAPDQAQDAKTR